MDSMKGNERMSESPVETLEKALGLHFMLKEKTVSQEVFKQQK